LPDESLEGLIEGVLKGETAPIAEALTRVEDARPAAVPVRRELVGRLEAQTPAQHTVVGLTGPPGAGKSCLAAALINHWTDEGWGVGMVAVDPTSRRSGGALLGDRARMRIRPGQPVFVRSMAARDRLGGLAPATRASAVVLRAVYPWTLVETVGVGQSEVDVETVADTVVLVLQPGSGDTLQFMKAGILEIPDVFVVHKWDLGAVAEQTRADLESILALRRPQARGWEPPVLGVSSQTGEGIAELARALHDHRAHLDQSGELGRRRERSRTVWALELFLERYGTLGLERLGGRESAERLARETPGTALDVFGELARRTGLEA
jgi:LAO/AO transport system kinase